MSLRLKSPVQFNHYVTEGEGPSPCQRNSKFRSILVSLFDAHHTVASSSSVTSHSCPFQKNKDFSPNFVSPFPRDHCFQIPLHVNGNAIEKIRSCLKPEQSKKLCFRTTIKRPTASSRVCMQTSSRGLENTVVDGALKCKLAGAIEVGC